jgi:hypothetical protein
MNVLDKDSLEFFKEELMEGTNKRLRLFEVGTASQMEMGRARLYEEKMTIQDYFNSCEDNVALLLINNPAQGLLGKIKDSIESKGLSWKEIEGTRFDLNNYNTPDIKWENWEKNKETPKVRLTESGKFVKKKI